VQSEMLWGPGTGSVAATACQDSDSLGSRSGRAQVGRTEYETDYGDEDTCVPGQGDNGDDQLED
jgi:hypothetical protein